MEPLYLLAKKHQHICFDKNKSWLDRPSSDMRIRISFFYACGSGPLQHLAQNYRLWCAFELPKPYSSALLHSRNNFVFEFAHCWGRYYPVVVHAEWTIRPFLYTELENVTDFWSHKAMAPLTSDLAFICTTSHTPACGATRLC
jgi:hypothetical protein